LTNLVDESGYRRRKFADGGDGQMEASLELNVREWLEQDRPCGFVNGAVFEPSGHDPDADASAH
jgi:hypothetical protein